ncbi:amidohydrolase [Streptomyces armeniacus]|uniref:Amidohydrolase n=1 Tax=Streptomyces armeniacus TaxID=83291 RepID=A0A345XTP8_9ACTN|nr:amidohydrolase family protein [Streptomyces armeniacus]AXK35014.1 amidohydrolase [Streptomyces armeniacus]
MTGPYGAAAEPPRSLRRVRLGAGGPLCDVRLEGGRVHGIRAHGAPQRDWEPSVDLEGRILLPGLWDAHVHIVQWAAARRRLDLAGLPSASAAAEAARGHAAGLEPGTPLIGYGFRDGLWPDAPHRDLLDAATGARAALLVSGDLHAVWLNSAALALLGRDGHPTGLLRETEALEATERLATADTPTSDEWVAQACAAAARRGVTGIIDFEYADNLTDWTRRMATGRIPLRVAAAVYPEYLDAAAARGLRTGDPVPVPGLEAGRYASGVPGGLLETGPLKLFTDGSLNTRTALCHDPYPGLPAGDPEARGIGLLTPAELAQTMRRAAAHGIEPAVHAIGDRANELALDAFAAVGCQGRVEHGQLLRPADVPRFAELGVTVGVQPSHAVDDRDVADRHWHGRTHRAFAYGDLLAAGARLEFGSDAPVAALDPWVTLANAVSRTDDGRPAWHPEQRLPVADALAASARGRRTVSTGDRADLVVVDADPLTADDATLRRMPVYGTLVAGVWTHLSA